MILIDSSAWIEYARASESGPDHRVDSLVRSGAELASTGAILMELLAGARDRAESGRIRDMLAAFTLLPAEDPRDYLQAASIYRACRAGGETLRGMLDCVIAAVAIREHAEILHHDRDFDAIARHTPLRLA